MDGKVVLITGATQGIGRESAVQLAQKGATVVIVGRDKERGLAALAEIRKRSGSDKVELLLADLCSFDDIRRLARDFNARHQRLHVLVNNAGAVHQTRKLGRDGIEMTFAVNHLAYFLLTHELLDVLKASAPARIVNVASEAHRGMKLDFADLESERRYIPFVAYGRSKLANLMFTYELARRLEGTGVTVNAVHPGVIASGFAKNDPGLFSFLAKLASPFLLSPEKGARMQVHVASAPELASVTGRFFKRMKPVTSSRASRDEAAQRRLWEMSEELVGLKPAATAAA